MSFARAWMQSLVRASGAAVLVPGTIVCALIVLGLAGGFSRLGSLGQAFSGPAAPPPAAAGGVAAAHASARLGKALTVLGAAAAPSAGAGLRPTAPGAIAGHSGAGSAHGGNAAGGGSGSGSGSGTGGRGTGGGTKVTGAGGSGHGGSAGTGTTPPTAPPTVVDGVVSVGTAVTSKVPGPAGSAATGVLQAVGHGLDHVLPIRVPAPGATGATGPAGVIAKLLP